ncbi:DUF4139 domain-containing protein [Rubellimicrobium roseum]|uniref:DUF4139 domain-containing protein n=1 Tax=Rubellimicrobium roseum TaxID=687525 RepID=A0A5C4NE88_9RHOB|nr:DUF4139 domain-containing protein [Rubellimicrobium roseum]TNC72953.1 DUF4139 domain-containing protein [Rubellimicrobium roseum]
MPLPRLAVSALALLAAEPALAQEAPVRAVTLFEAGLAEITRETGAAREITLSVPLRDVNDILKSLLVRGRGIEGARLALDGATPVEDAFASLPFPPAAATNLEMLLETVPGLRLRVSDRAYPQGQEGTLMGFMEDCDDQGCETVLSLLGDDGVVTFHPLTGDYRIAILDPEIVAALGQGLRALRSEASGTVREIAVEIEGEAVADGAISYVIAAPAWKTSYRALTGEGGTVDLQAWAVIENATGEPWDDVALTLSSGSPRTLTADLHGRDWRYRETVETDEAVAFEPVTVVEPEAPRASLGMGADVAESFAAPAPAPVTASAAQEEGVLDSRFRFPDPVDLAAGEMASLPFLTGSLDARHLSLYEGRLQTRTGNPDLVLEVTNDLDVRLPAGIMTVSDEAGGYVGDADFPLVGPGETRAVPFGLDRSLRVEETVGFASRRTSVRAAEGVLRVTVEDVRDATYAVTSPGGEAHGLVIDHPLTPDWTATVVEGPKGIERQDEAGRRFLRATLTVPAQGAARLVVRDVHPYEQVLVLGDLPEDELLVWAAEASDAATRAYLEEAAALMRAASRSRDALDDAERAHADLADEQARVRQNLGAVPSPSEAHDRYLADLLAIEDRLAAATDVRAARREDLATAQAALAAHLGEG